MHYFKSVLATGLLSLFIIGCKKEAPLTRTNLQHSEQHMIASKSPHGKGTNTNPALTQKLQNIKMDFRYQDFKNYHYKGQNKNDRDHKIRTRTNMKTSKNKIKLEITRFDHKNYIHILTRFPDLLSNNAPSDGSSSIRWVNFEDVSKIVRKKNRDSSLSEYDKLNMVDFVMSQIYCNDFSDTELEPEYELVN